MKDRIKEDIKSRQDLALLVRSFYKKVRNDALLGPIFKEIITDWETHFEHLTDFWETNLFFRKTYQGNPIRSHIDTDQKMKGAINELHFGVWLNLWFQTIDALFEGEVAQIAKNRARNMGSYLHIAIFNARKKDLQ